MKKCLRLLVCLILLVPMVGLHAAGDQYQSHSIKTKVNTRCALPHSEPARGYMWNWYWSLDGKTWTSLKTNTPSSSYVRTSYFTFEASYTSTSAYVTFYNSGTYYLRGYIPHEFSSTGDYYDVIETYNITVEKAADPIISVSPSTVSLTGGGSTTLSVSRTNANSYDYYSTNPSVASVTSENGSLVLKAWNPGTTTIKFTAYGDSSNASAGCNVTVTGTSAAKPISLCKISSIGEQAYTGSPITPSVTVKDEKVTLQQNVDYTLSYRNNTAAGTATVTVTGIGAYSGKAETSFTIRRLYSVSDAKIELQGAADLIYNGSSQKPTPTVTLDGKNLVQGTDYTVSYRNNVNAGTAAVVIYGTGDYNGTAEKEFTIAKAEQAIKVTVRNDTISVEDTTSVSVSNAKTALEYISSNPSIASVSSSGLITALRNGYVTITVHAVEGANYKAASATKQVDIFSRSGMCGSNVKWCWDGETLYFLGTGKMNDYASSSAMPWYSFRSKIKHIDLSSSVPNIGNYAFADCTNLESVSIPDGIQVIGDRSFFNCSSLTGVVLSNTVTTIDELAFHNCAMTDLVIPDSVTTLGERAFQSCTKLKNITMSDKLKSKIDIKSVFKNTRWLQEQYPQYVYDIDSSGCLIAYRGSESKVIIPDGVTRIGESAFILYKGLKSVTIPKGVYSIQKCAFLSCQNLTSVVLPVSVGYISPQAFDFCYVLTDVFYAGSESQKGNITVDTGNTYLQQALWHVNYVDYTTLLTLTLPESLITIESQAFVNTGAQVIIIPASCKSVAEDAFDGCTNLQYIVNRSGITIVPPSGVTVITE